MKKFLIACMLALVVTGCNLEPKKGDQLTRDNVQYSAEIYERDSTAAPEVKEAAKAWYKEWAEYEEAKRDDDDSD